MSKELDFKRTLVKYIPNVFVGYVSRLLIESNVSFKIVAPRSTKLGDFRIQKKGSNKPQITVNGDLNPYSFLITTIHEVAHLKTHNKYGCKVNPHGLEWKSEFSHLLKPILDHVALPADLKKVLSSSITNLKASSCTDIKLARELKKYNQSKNTLSLEELIENSLFILNKKTYSKGKLRRTRYLCKELNTGKSYLIHALAEVKEVINE
jgi:SprT protein